MDWYVGIGGYLEVILWGESPERVVNMALSRGIYLWDIRQVEKGRFLLKVKLGGYKALRHLVRRSSCRLRIVKKIGLPFHIMRAKKRKVLVSGLLFFCIALYILSSFVWFIEVKGNQKVSTDRIIKEVRSSGLKIGVPKNSLQRERIKYELITKIPELAWSALHLEGTRIVIEVAERTLIPDGDERQPADMIARVEGKIEEILVLKGTTMVKEGDYVNKGQLLISGLVYPQIQVNDNGSITPSGVPERVRARALVRAKVHRDIIGVCPMREEIYRDTGAQTKVIMIRFMGRDVIVQGPRKVPYRYFRQVSQVKPYLAGRIPWGPVELHTIVYIEQSHEVREWGIEGAYEEAQHRAKNKLLEELPLDYRIEEEGHEPVSSEDNSLVMVRYYIETIEDIGSYPLIR